MREVRPGGRVVVVVVAVFSLLALLLSINIVSQPVTAKGGVECGTPKDPVYSWLPNLDPPDTPKGPAVDRKRALCKDALIDNGFWPVVLLLGGFVVSFLAMMAVIVFGRRPEAPDEPQPLAEHAPVS
jgi:hypothetical protein